MQRGSIEHEQIIYESSNRRMKQQLRFVRFQDRGLHVLLAFLSPADER